MSLKNFPSRLHSYGSFCALASASRFFTHLRQNGDSLNSSGVHLILRPQYWQHRTVSSITPCPLPVQVS
jgi:hypothetical protein